MSALLTRWRTAAQSLPLSATTGSPAGSTAGPLTGPAADADLDRAGQDLIARWTEPHRRYHTVDHLVSMLDVIDRHADVAADADAVRVAAWFHDAVYDPQAPDNEERSVALAERMLDDLGATDDARAEVCRLIRLTVGHDPAPDDRNGALLADADLAVLATDPATYAGYAAAVRAEYAHVPDDAFRVGRSAVLRRLLALPTLYRIVPARAEWSARARANLHQELTTLSAPTG
ncbi:MAG TPA: metal-dependent phosphohydrolase [Micromonosporaceae bacterium]|nr:metal-dependent phosphohydrolase [Micromonosporaceae bacterium]